jgi:DNA-binding LacI/PurR family transcriptional regulator
VKSADKRVTIRDVAADVGVSIATVSRVLSGDQRIGSVTSRNVVEAADRLKYRPSEAARRLRTQSSELLGVIVEGLGNEYVGEVVKGIQEQAVQHGLRPLIVASEGQERLEIEAVDVFFAEQVDAFIAVSPLLRPKVLHRAVDRGLRVSVVNWDPGVPANRLVDVAEGTGRIPLTQGRGSIDRSISQVRVDDLGAGKMATLHLIGLGHRRLAHLRGPDVRSSLWRMVGFRRALESKGLWPQPVIVPDVDTLEANEKAVEAFLRRRKPPLGLVAYNDMNALAALRAAQSAGWRVPEDLSVVGIDDIPFAAYTNPALTTVAQPKREMGSLAVDLVLQQKVVRPALHILEGNLVERDSTRAVALATTKSGKTS